MYSVSYRSSQETGQVRTSNVQAISVAELQSGKIVTAINGAAVTTKLQQIASGAVYHDDEAVLVDNGRYSLIHLIEATTSVCFFLWRHQRDELIKEAERRGVTFCVIDGDTPSREREEMVQHYQNGFCRAMFAHPQSAGADIDAQYSDHLGQRHSTSNISLQEITVTVTGKEPHGDHCGYSPRTPSTSISTPVL